MLIKIDEGLWMDDSLLTLEAIAKMKSEVEEVGPSGMPKMLYGFPIVLEQAPDQVERRGDDMANDELPCPPDRHIWGGQKTTGSPSEPDDYVEYCLICGAENQGSGVLQ